MTFNHNTAHSFPQDLELPAEYQVEHTSTKEEILKVQITQQTLPVL